MRQTFYQTVWSYVRRRHKKPQNTCTFWLRFGVRQLQLFKLHSFLDRLLASSKGKASGQHRDFFLRPPSGQISSLHKASYEVCGRCRSDRSREVHTTIGLSSSLQIRHRRSGRFTAQNGRDQRHHRPSMHPRHGAARFSRDPAGQACGAEHRAAGALRNSIGRELLSQLLGWNRRQSADLRHPVQALCPVAASSACIL